MRRYQPLVFTKDLLAGPSRAGLASSAPLLQASSFERSPKRGLACHPQLTAPTVDAARAIDLSRRQMIAAAAALCASMSTRRAEAAELETRYDFTRPLDGWETVSGTWAIEDVPGAYRDSRFGSGKVGLWTKADSVTAFDSLVVRPL